MTQKELFLEQQKEVQSYQNRSNFNINDYFVLLVKYIKEGNYLLIDDAVDFLVDQYNSLNDPLYLKACFAIANHDVLFYELMSFEEQVRYEQAKMKALTYYGCYVNNKFLKQANNLIREYTYLVDDGKELYFKALISKTDYNDPNHEERYLNDLNNYYLLGNDLSVEEAKDLGINSDVYYMDANALLKMLDTASEEDKLGILRQLVHLGNIKELDKLKDLDRLFNYDLFMYSKYPNGLPKEKATKKAVTQKQATKKEEQIVVQNPNNIELYNLSANNFLMTFFLAVMICYVVLTLQGFLEYEFDSSFPSVMLELAIGFLPCLYLLLRGIRNRKNDYNKRKNNVIFTFLVSIPLTIITAYCFAMFEECTELFLKFDHKYWFTGVGAMLIGNYFALVIIGLLNVAFDKNKKLNIISLILSTLGYAFLAVVLPVILVIITGNF